MILILFLIMDGEYAFDGVAMVEVCEVCILIMCNVVVPNRTQ